MKGSYVAIWQRGRSTDEPRHVTLSGNGSRSGVDGSPLSLAAFGMAYQAK